MNDISRVLDRLEAQSNREKSREVSVAPKDRMLAITKETGEMLQAVIHVKNARNVLEVGTSVGYSTIWCAGAVTEPGRIITIENNPEKIKRARSNFESAGVSGIITILEGSALKILEEMGRQKKYAEFFDLVLIDADKENAVEYFDLIFPMVKVGGTIVTDNMLYPEKYREHMARFAARLGRNPRVRTMTSGIGNGEEITVRVS